MKVWLKALIEKGDALTTRERSILFLLLIAAVWAVADLAFLAPLQQARKAETARIEAAQASLQRVQALQAEQARTTPPEAVARERLAAAQTALARLTQAAPHFSQHLVAPRQMAQVLQHLTRAQPGLRLVGLKSLPPEPVGKLAANPGASSPAPVSGGLYRQGVQITLAGSYAALVRYMQALEKLPMGFLWDQATLDARAHPDIHLTLTLYTLSLEQEWLRL